jgi:4-amino-4-deoxy-L-arabinose transferase-like glycosyltransferase
MEKKHLIIFILILFLGAFLRLVNLTSNPPALNWDEISHGYNAYSVLKTGMDQWGEKLPIFNFRAYGDYPTTLNLYLTVPFIFLMGLSELSIRLPHALIGILSIISVYFLAFGVTRKAKPALIAAFLFSIDPWHVFSSRFVLQSNISVFLLITSAAFFVNHKMNKWNLTIAALMLFLTLFSYHTTRIFSPLILMAVFFIYSKSLKSKIAYLYVFLFISISAFIFLNPTARARSQVLFLLDKGAVAKIEHARNTSKLPQSLNKLINNRPVYFVTGFVKNYISYFSPEFLFLTGGTQYQFSVQGKGLVYPASMPFFYIGLFLLISLSFKSKNYRALLVWLLISPIPASLTNEQFTVIRATTMLPLPQILTSLGLLYVAEKYFKKHSGKFLTAFALIELTFLTTYLNTYFNEYKISYSWSWQYGHKEAVNLTAGKYANYDRVIVSKKYGEPHEFWLFYLKYDPAKYLADANKITYYADSWWWVDSFDKYLFVNDWDVKKLKTPKGEAVNCSTMNCVLVTSPGNFPEGWNFKESIKFLDGRTAFEIYTND